MSNHILSALCSFLLAMASQPLFSQGSVKVELSPREGGLILLSVEFAGLKSGGIGTVSDPKSLKTLCKAEFIGTASGEISRCKIVVPESDLLPDGSLILRVFGENGNPLFHAVLNPKVGANNGTISWNGGTTPGGTSGPMRPTPCPPSPCRYWLGVCNGGGTVWACCSSDPLINLVTCQIDCDRC